MLLEFNLRKMATVDNRTFANEDDLPSLIVPTLQQTITKYLDSCKALLDEDAYAETEQVCRKFLDSPVTAKLHDKLVERAKTSKNWLEEWWLKKAYLELRVPLPLINYSGPASYAENYWPLKDGEQLTRSAWNIHIFYLFWETVRKEKMPVHRTAKGEPLSMNQFRYLFNTYRRPCLNQDELLHYFKTEAEGDSPTHAIVMCKGYIFQIDGYDHTSKSLKPPEEIYEMLKWIESYCAQKSAPGPSVGVLTTLDRNKWASVRKYMVTSNTHNQNLIESIEKSLFVFCLDETSPISYTEVCRDISFGNWQNRWFDKSYTGVSFRNGGFATNCDHTPCDAMVMAVLCEYNISMLAKFANCPFDPTKMILKDEPFELDFKLDSQLLQDIAGAKQNAAAIEANVDMVQPIFKNFGKKLFKELKIHPDFAVQISLQLAYMEIHGEPAPTYETAMTRKYYHGRTETCRTCTPEVVEFCRCMLESFDTPSPPISKLQGLLENAQKKFLYLMGECMLNKGCDRHLYALSLLADEEKLPLPELFSHPSYTATGGKGNFVLSTSCLGYSVIQGVVAPMLERGYGCFYRINDEKIVYSVTSYNTCTDTSSQRFADHFEHSLNRVIRLKSTSPKI